MEPDNVTTGDARATRFVLAPHRSLRPTGFLVLMGLVAGVSFVSGIVFASIGAWPVTAFFGLDVALIYLAFRLSYRSGRIVESIDISPERLELLRVHPSGREERFALNPFFARVRLIEGPGGRTDLRLTARGEELRFAAFLTDDERRDLAEALTGALATARR